MFTKITNDEDAAHATDDVKGVGIMEKLGMKRERIQIRKEPLP